MSWEEDKVFPKSDTFPKREETESEFEESKENLLVLEAGDPIDKTDKYALVFKIKANGKIKVVNKTIYNPQNITVNQKIWELYVKMSNWGIYRYKK